MVAALEAATWTEIFDDLTALDLGLDPDETAAILLSQQLQADELLMNVAALGSGSQGHLGHRHARGVVAGAPRLGVLGRAVPLVAELRADGFWLSDGLVANFLRCLGETA